MENMRNIPIPPGNAAGRLVRLVLFGGASIYGLTNSLFNVEGGHRAIVFNRLVGIKDRVRPMIPAGPESLLHACPLLRIKLQNLLYYRLEVFEIALLEYTAPHFIMVVLGRMQPTMLTCLQSQYNFRHRPRIKQLSIILVMVAGVQPDFTWWITLCIEMLISYSFDVTPTMVSWGIDC
jgi:hypothetical protein